MVLSSVDNIKDIEILNNKSSNKFLLVEKLKEINIMKNFWKNKKVLITGHTGFKGSWMTLILNMLGAKLYGYALDPITKPNFFDGLKLNKFLVKDFRKDITNKKEFYKVIKKVKPSIIFHLAAQSSVLESYKKSEKTFFTNVVGTINVLESLRKVKSIKSLLLLPRTKYI